MIAAAALVPLPVIVPLFAAALLAALSARLHRQVTNAIALTAAAGCTLVDLALLRATIRTPIVTWFGGWRPTARQFPIGIDFIADPISAGLAGFCALLVVLAFLYTAARFRAVKALFHVLMLVFLGAMSGLCLSGDLFNLFVWFELMTAAAVALCGYKCQETGPLQGALNFAVTNAVGAFITLTGIAFLYAFSGSLNFAAVGEALRAHPPDALFVGAALLFTLAGFLIKAAAYPFHFWLADAHAVAPVPVCILFSGVMVELGVYAIGRIWFGVFAAGWAGHESAVRGLLIAIGVSTAAIGALECYVQHHLKRMLAFSTISHTGLMLVGLGLLTPASFSGFLIYLYAHGLLKACLFLCAGMLLHRFGSLDEHVLHGKGRAIPGFGVLMAAAALGLAALPPYGTFFADAFFDTARSQRHAHWIAAIFVFAAALTTGAVLRFAARVGFGIGAPAPETQETPKREDRETHENPHRTPPAMALPAVAALLLAFLPAVLPDARGAVHAYADVWMRSHLYAATVLQAAPAPPAALPLRPAATYWPSLLSLGLALLLAAASLAPRSDAAARLLFKPWSPFHSFQSGRVTDYVAWLAFGLAGWGAVLLLNVR